MSINMASPGPRAIDSASPPPPGASHPFVNIPIRPMRVKVLYTFDNENKTNCLARLPEVVNAHAIPIDETTHIGVIELRTCIKAIVDASPELVSRLSQADFTIYAYDYSEYETPLVGQGMLSALLAAASPTPNAPAHQSKTMITGRICKNVMGIFSNGVAETLEVKLRLVPVPRPVQQEYVRSMETLRATQPAMSSGIDFHAWSDAIHAASPVPTPAPEDDDMSEIFPTRPTAEQRRMSDAAFAGYNGSHHARATGRHTARPSSRASVRSEYTSRPMPMSYVSEPNLVDTRQDDGPARKRAKVTQTEWRGKSAIGATDDSLRVTASSAASIRIHKPVATRPSVAGHKSLEPPPRAPTPVASYKQYTQQHFPALARRESTLCNVRRPDSPYIEDQSDIGSSPGAMQGVESVVCTPLEFPSSPPALPEPSSPGLPLLSRAVDSGYMSSSAGDMIPDNENRAIDRGHVQTVNPYKPRQSKPVLQKEISFIEQTPGPPELLPTRMQMQPNSSQQNAHNSTMNARRSTHVAATRPLMAKASSIDSVTERVKSPTVALEKLNSDLQAVHASTRPPPPRTNTPKPRQKSQSPQPREQPKAQAQSQSQARPQSPHPANEPARTEMAKLSEAHGVSIARTVSPAPSEANTKPPRSGSGAKRQQKRSVQDRLIKDVASGVMPIYCSNCGAIDTPTWRTLHVKVIEGSPDDLEPADKDGENTAIEILDRDVAFDKIKKFRLIKCMRKCKDAQMQGFDASYVCNPCGLWFYKFKGMRPAHKWNMQKKKKRTKNDGLQSDMVEPTSDFPQSDAPPMLVRDQSTVTEAPVEESIEEEEEVAEEVVSHVAPPIAPRPRANSMQPHSNTTSTTGNWTSTDLGAALARAIQSSPMRVGSQQSPIDLEEDLTPKPTRRLLFPSPRKDGEDKSLEGDGGIERPKSAGPTDETKDAMTPHTEVLGGGVESMGKPVDKENIDPNGNGEFDFQDLFGPGGSPSLLQSIFKTPSKISSSARQTPPSKPLTCFEGFGFSTPSPLRRSLGMTGSTDKMVMNSKATPMASSVIDAFLPTFSSVERDSLFPRTPTRQASQTFSTSPSRGGDGQPVEIMTPFTRHLTQLLNRSDTVASSDFVLDMGSSSHGGFVGSGGGGGGLDLCNMAGLSSPGKPFDFGDLPNFGGTPPRKDADADANAVADGDAGDVTMVEATEVNGLGLETQG